MSLWQLQKMVVTARTNSVSVWRGELVESVHLPHTFPKVENLTFSKKTSQKYLPPRYEILEVFIREHSPARTRKPEP